MAMQTPTYTPLTDADLNVLDRGSGVSAELNVAARGAAAEIRALRAENAELFGRHCEKGQAISVAEAEKATLRASEARLLAALKAITARFEKWVAEGGCDHSVGICVCGDQMEIDGANELIAAAEGRAE